MNLGLMIFIANTLINKNTQKKIPAWFLNLSLKLSFNLSDFMFFSDTLVRSHEHRKWRAKRVSSSAQILHQQERQQEKHAKRSTKAEANAVKFSLAAGVTHSPLERVELFARVLSLVSFPLPPHAGTTVGFAGATGRRKYNGGC